MEGGGERSGFHSFGKNHVISGGEGWGAAGVAG